MAVKFVPSIRRTIQSVLILALLAAANAQAARTLMFLVDWWTNGPMDTIIGLNVFQPNEVVYTGAGGLPVPQKTNAYVQPGYEPLSNANNPMAYWYALPNFSPDDYATGRIRINDLYQRGWYQWDSTYRVATDTVLTLSKIRVKDTAVTFTYRDPVTQRDTTIAVAPAAAGFTKTVTLPAGATFRGPKLYTSNGNGGTPLLNQRPTSTTGGSLPGSIDKCLDSLVSDTVWIRFIPAGNQQPTEAQMKCTGYNPFAVLRARVFLRSPWPGSSPTVEWNGQQIQMYPWPSNPDWMYAELRYLPPLGKPALSFRFRKSAGSAEYFDSSGVNTGTIAPFNYPTAADGLNYWFVPPEGGGPLLATKGTAATYPPLKAPYYLYVQNPWSPGTPRVVWPNDPSARVTRPTEYCGWYKYPLYTKPTQMLIGHSFEDSLFGTAGIQFRTRSNWVTLSMRASDSTYWVQTFVGTTKVRAQQATATTSPATTACSTDTLKLVMEAFDFKGRGDAGGNPAFQIGGAADNTGGASSGLVKGMVQKNLSAAGLPVYTGRDSGYQIGGINGQGHSPALALPAAQYGKSTPSNWFDTVALKLAVPNITIGHTCLELPLVKTPADNGYYKYDNQSFFPLDNITDTRGVSPLMDAKSVSHNFLYCLKGHAAFEYTPGLKFEFRGDDDVWVFINKQLAVDLGGTHAPESTYVDIDKLHLVEGQVYPFDIFYCERQTNGSSILIRTSMDLQPSWQYKDSVQLKSKDSTILQVWGQKSQNYRPTCADLNAAPIWQPTNGRVVLVGPDGSDLYLTFNTDTSLYGGFLTFINGRLKVDTTNLIKRSELSWNGVYTIYLQSKVGDPLDSIKFSKKYGSVIVQGTVIDVDGDGIADSVRLVSPKAILADNPSYHVVWFDASGKRDSLTVPVAQVNKISDSLVVVPLARVPSWGIRTALPAVRADSLGAILTYPGGGTTAIINYIHLNDGIAPVADSAYLQYDASGTGNDTLFVWASEPVKSSASTSMAWAILGGRSNFRDSTNVTASILGNGTRFALVFAPGTNPYLPGDSLRLGPQTGDVAGNAPGALSRWVPIVTNTVVRSWMMDRDGDGAPDSVGIFSRGSLAGTNSVLVHWKTAAGGDTTVSVTTPAGITTGGIKLPADILGGATYCQACTIDIVSGGVAKTYPLADSVPAAAVKASFHYGSGTDTLVVVASEALSKVDVLNEGWVASKPAGSISVLGNLVAAGTTRVSGDTLVIQLPAGTFAGDSVRLRKWSGDLFTNVPGDTSPWVNVEFGNQPIRVVVWDADGDGRADNVKFSLSRSAAGAPSPASFTVQWGGQALSVASLTRSADSLSWSGTIGPFAAATTAPLAGEQGWMVVGSDSLTWRARVVDSVPPVATKAVLRFGLTYDTLVVTASEGLTQGSTAGEGWFGQKSAPAAGGLGTLVAGTLLGAPTNVVTLLVAPGAVSGDSLRLRGWSRDAFGNAPGANSVWVPIEYGPQPIRVQVYDQDGDGRADSVVYRLTRSAVGAPVPVRFGLTWGGNFVSVSGLAASSDGMSWRGAVGPLPFGTKPSAGDAGWIVTAVDSTSYRALAEDSVAPVATIGKLVFGYATGAPDTILVTGSEVLALSGTNFVLLNSDSSETGATSPTAAQILSSSVANGPLRLVVSSGSISGTAAWIRFGTSVSDGFAPVAAAHSRWVRLVVTPSGHAALYDSDGDGRADSAHVWIRGTLPAGTAVLTWSDTSGAADSRTWPVAGASSGFDIKPTTSSLWFQKGATACLTNNCHIAFYDASGVQLVDWALQDSVAPIVLSGYYTFGSNGFDSLNLRLSEPVKLAGGQTAVWLNWGGKTGATGPIVPMSSSVSIVGGSGLVVVDSSKGAHADWDSVRFDLRAGTTDQGGAHLGAATPWGPIIYGLPAMVARVTDPLGQGCGTDVKIRLVHPVPAQALSQVQSFQVPWSTESRTISANTLAWDAATNTWSGSVGAPFKTGVTSMGNATGAQVSGSTGTVRQIGLEDGVPPAIVRARYRYSTAEVAQDTLLVEFSEPWAGEAPGNVNDPFVTAKNRRNPLSVAPMRNWSLLDPQKLEIILDTTWENKLARGDSARLSYQSSGSRIWDGAGNRVDSLSVWVPIEFGLRPAEFSIRQQHAMVTNFGDLSWPEPGANVPAVEFVVRKDGTSGNNPGDWVVIGDPSQMLGPGNSVVGGNQPANDWEHVMSVTIRLNRPLDGVLFIYDNAGVSVLQRDLGVLRNLWPAGSEDALRDVRITWNGVGPDGKFAASGVYLLRAVVKMSDSEGHKYFKNLLWKYGWKRPTK